MSGGESNGKERIIGCPFNSWDIVEDDLLKALATVGESHVLLNTLVAHTKYLPDIAKDSAEIKACLLSAAIGKEHVPMTVVEKILKIFGWVIFGLVGVIICLLTGAQFGWLPSLH